MQPLEQMADRMLEQTRSTRRPLPSLWPLLITLTVPLGVAGAVFGWIWARTFQLATGDVPHGLGFTASFTVDTALFCGLIAVVIAIVLATVVWGVDICCR